jgi:hypothetical protein
LLLSQLVDGVVEAFVNIGQLRNVSLHCISLKYCMNIVPRKLFDPTFLPPVPGGHDTNNFCSWGTVRNVIIFGAVIPLLEASSGQ